MKETLSKILDVIGKILAIVFVLVFALMIIDASFPFISKVPTLYNVLAIIWQYGALLLAVITGLEALVKHNFIFVILFLVVVALIVIFMFFPGTYENLIGLIKKN